MKQIRMHGTAMALLISFLISYLIVSPVFFDLSRAQSMDTTPPVIAHNPVKLAYRDKPLKLTLRVADESKIKRVTITINYGGKSITGTVPLQKGMLDVPVLVEASRKLIIYSGAGEQYKKKGKVSAGKQLYVTGMKNNYYRVRYGNITGYVKAADTQIVLRGRGYGVKLPSKFTNQPTLSYSLTATDINDNTTTTDVYQVKLLTKEEVAQLLARTGLARKQKKAAAAPPPEKKEKGSFKALWFLTGMALVGGGVYYYLTQYKQADKTATVEVVAEWK